LDSIETFAANKALIIPRRRNFFMSGENPHENKVFFEKGGEPDKRISQL